MTRKIKFTKIMIHFIVVSFILSSCKPQINEEIMDVLDKIGDEYHYNPMVSEEEKQVIYLARLGKIATWNQLTYIQDNDSVPMARLAAFMCIMHINPQCAKAIAVRELQDTKHVVPVQYYCEYDSQPISNVYISLLTQEGKKYGLTDKDSIELDSVLLYTPHLKHIDYLNDLLEILPPHKTYYQRIRELFVKDHNIYALRALARYKKPKDYKFILSALQGKVENPIDLVKYQENEKWSNKYQSQKPKYYSIHDTWHYNAYSDFYNNPNIVNDVALECIYECPAPIFKKYMREAKENHDRKMECLAWIREHE